MAKDLFHPRKRKVHAERRGAAYFLGAALANIERPPPPAPPLTHRQEVRLERGLPVTDGQEVSQ